MHKAIKSVLTFRPHALEGDLQIEERRARAEVSDPWASDPFANKPKMSFHSVQIEQAARFAPLQRKYADD